MAGFGPATPYRQSKRWGTAGAERDGGTPLDHRLADHEARGRGRDGPDSRDNSAIMVEKKKP